MTTDEQRDAMLARLCPTLFTQPDAAVLYVGAKPGRMDYADRFRAAGARLCVVEAHEPNADAVRRECPWVSMVIHGDIRGAEVPRVHWVFWWHGPEHIPAFDLPHTLRRIESLAELGVVLGSPWGDVPQGEVDGNPFEKHVAAIEKGALEALGYTCEYAGERGVCGSSVVAVKVTA
jgi:hypothetical protein